MKRMSVLLGTFMFLLASIHASETGSDDPKKLLELSLNDKATIDQQFAARRDLVALKEKAVPTCIDALKSSDARVRSQCASVLGDLGASAEPARAALIQALHDPDRTVSHSAACSLAHFSPREKAAVPVLIGFLTLPESANTDDVSAAIASLEQAQAAEALAAMGADAAVAVHPLAKVVAHGALPFSRAAAADALGKLPNSVDALTYLKDELGKWERIHNVLKGSPAAEIATAIVKIDHASGTEPDKAAVNALLRELAAKSDKRARRQAACGLAAANSSDERIAPALVHALKDDDTNVRIRAAAALLHLNEHVREATDTLQVAAQSNEQLERVLARQALRKNNIALVVPEKHEDQAQDVSVPGDDYLFH